MAVYTGPGEAVDDMLGSTARSFAVCAVPLVDLRVSPRPLLCYAFS